MTHSPPRPAPTANPHIPAPHAAQVWLDFDGTVTTTDLLDELINRFSRNDSWKAIEAQWAAGAIGSRECLGAEFALLDLSHEQLDAEQRRVRLDPGAADLLSFLRGAAVPVTILSDGVDTFIQSIFRHHQLTPPAVRANRVEHHGRSLTLHYPHANPACDTNSAHCKCSSAIALSTPGRKSIYIGDGRSDLCAARKSDLVFAKRALADALTREARPFIPFTTLADVRDTLARAWSLHSAEAHA